jgi:hypothetical protein
VFPFEQQRISFGAIKPSEPRKITRRGSVGFKNIVYIYPGAGVTFALIPYLISTAPDRGVSVRSMATAMRKRQRGRRLSGSSSSSVTDSGGRTSSGSDDAPDAAPRRRRRRVGNKATSPPRRKRERCAEDDDETVTKADRGLMALGKVEAYGDMFKKWGDLDESRTAAAAAAHDMHVGARMGVFHPSHHAARVQTGATVAVPQQAAAVAVSAGPAALSATAHCVSCPSVTDSTSCVFCADCCDSLRQHKTSPCVDVIHLKLRAILNKRAKEAVTYG